MAGIFFGIFFRRRGSHRTPPMNDATEPNAELGIAVAAAVK
jgi:hypothetical protein